MSAAAYAAMVDELVAMRVPLHMAEARARQEYPEVAQLLDVATQKRANALEKDEQRAIRKMAIAVGFKVYWLSQAERSGQTPGLADLWMVHVGRKIALWWEAKRSVGGTRSSVQVEFGDECIACDVGYSFGDRRTFARWLVDHGFPSLPIPE